MKHFFEVMLSDCAAHLPVCTGQATSTSFSKSYVFTRTSSAEDESKVALPSLLFVLSAQCHR